MSKVDVSKLVIGAALTVAVIEVLTLSILKRLATFSINGGFELKGLTIIIYIYIHIYIYIY